MAEKNNLGELIPIKSENGQRAVNARDLHSFLESKQKFADWIKSRIDQYGFIENQDYQILASENYEASWGGGNKVEYALSIDMAKELSMVERNQKGKEARSYFIACEKIAVKKTIESKQKPKREPSLMQQMKLGVEWVRNVSDILNLNDASKLTLLGKVAKPLELPMPDYVPSNGILKSATELLHERKTQISAREFNTVAIQKGILCELERNAAHGQKKKFKSITKAGLAYGENQVNPNNPKSTQPSWYADKFDELLKVLGFQTLEELPYENN